MKRALILGGGGTIGVAWESGLLAGLAEGGVDVRSADLVVGTSAGSIVGTRVAAGKLPGETSSPETEARLRSQRTLPQPMTGFDLSLLTRVFKIWGEAEKVSEALCAEIGALALQARNIDEESWVAQIGSSTGTEVWPNTALRITAVDAESGAFMAFDRASGAELERAVAASCAVPGMFPPVSIGGRRFMDGGVRSGTNADLALDLRPDAVLVIAPISKHTAAFGPLAERCLWEEVEQLRAAGALVCCVLPNEADRQTFGPNLMNPKRAGAAREIGYRRGLELARSEVSFWND